jgi:hypothetical protein
MGVSPSDPKALQGPLEPLAERRPGRWGWSGIEDPLDRLQVSRVQGVHDIEDRRAQVRGDGGVLGRELGAWHREERRLAEGLTPAKTSVAECPALERSDAQSPGEDVAVLPELAGIEEELHQGTLGGVLGQLRIPERTAAEAPQEWPERRKDRLEGRPVPARERDHLTLESLVLRWVHRLPVPPRPRLME